MREDVYRRIVQTITWHHSWITVQDADRYEPRSVVREGRTFLVACRIMVLRVVYNRGKYKRGQTVSISEYELANALANCRKDFLQRRDRREKPPFVIGRHESVDNGGSTPIYPLYNIKMISDEQRKTDIIRYPPDEPCRP